MKGCVAPSEIPGITNGESRVFGAVAENLIYADFCSKYSRQLTELFADDHNLSGYIYFLAKNNPHFDQAMQEDYFRNAYSNKYAKIPDLVLHKPNEKAFYEIKPDSSAGRSAGLNKIDKLNVVYSIYNLPYRPGTSFNPRDHTLANFGRILRVTLRVRRTEPGLLLYRLCVESEVELELVIVLSLLGYIVRHFNSQKNRTTYHPLDLRPVFNILNLEDLAKSLGITMVGAGAAAVGWKYFWKACIKRFALRGSAALTLSAADGPLPVGELLSIGLALWTVIDIVRLSDELWKDAAKIAQKGA